jgi:hypothetical protein
MEILLLGNTLRAPLFHASLLVLKRFHYDSTSVYTQRRELRTQYFFNDHGMGG